MPFDDAFHYYQHSGEDNQNQRKRDFFYRQQMKNNYNYYNRRRESDPNPFDDRYASDQEKMKRKMRREKWRQEDVFRAKDDMKTNVEKFARVRDRAVFARAIRVSDILAKSFLSSPTLILVDLSAVGVIGTCVYAFMQ